MGQKDDSAGEDTGIVLGYVSGVYGVQGWVKLHSYTEPREALLDYRDCYLRHANASRRVHLGESRRHGKTLIAKLDGIDDREAAASIAGAQLAVSRDELPELDEGHYYWADLEGLKVCREAGAEIGTVSHLMTTGANDVLVVVGEEKEVLIPFVMGSVILDVDLQAGSITVDWDWD